MTNEPTTSQVPAPPTHPAQGRRFGFGALVLAALASSAVAGGGAWWLAHSHPHDAGGGKPAAVEAPKLKYVCPMHPTIVQDHPGDCPICGMKLVLAEEEKGASAAGHAGPAAAGLSAVEIDPARQQLIGLTTAAVERGPVGGAWRTVGRVAVDETRVRRVNLKVPGYVERVFVDFVGKPVRQGDPLFTVYSPELVSAQEEYLLAQRTQKALARGGALENDGDVLVAGARRKLALWDISEKEIERIATSGVTKTLTIASPVSGVVTRKDVVEGMKLEAGAMPYEIVDLSSVWVLADVYESELRFIKEGMSASLTLNAFPDREFKGRVLFVDPLLDPQTRTVKVRLAFANPGGELRPEMFGEVVLRGKAREGLRVPRDAVVDSGVEKIVFVAADGGRFQPREVRLGAASGDFVEVLFGVAEAERVVTRANFLLDSESRLRSSLAELGARPEGPQSARVLDSGAQPAPAEPRR